MKTKSVDERGLVGESWVALDLGVDLMQSSGGHSKALRGPDLVRGPPIEYPNVGLRSGKGADTAKGFKQADCWHAAA